MANPKRLIAWASTIADSALGRLKSMPGENHEVAEAPGARRLPMIGDAISPPFFQGSFASIDDVMTNGANPFDLDPWLDTAKFRLQHLLTAAKQKYFVSESHLWPFFGTIAALAATHGRLSILDFGGGIGDNFVQWTSVAPAALTTRVEYYIVDTRRNCEIGNESLSDCGHAVRFIESSEFLDAAPELHYDAAMLCGVLQYMTDWRSAIRTIAQRTKRFVYITRTQLNEDVPTFYTRQLLSPETGPWAGKFIGETAAAIINPSELRLALAEEGFEEIIGMVLYDYRHAAINHSGASAEVYQGMTLFERRSGLQSPA